MKLSSRMDRVIESQTLAMTKKARELSESGIDVISLSIGEPDFDTPVNICDEASEAMNRGETHYPPVLGTLNFRKAIQKKLLNENNIKVELNEIIVSNGAKHSLFNAIMTLINPGDEVIIPTPYWVSYPAMVQFAQGKVVEIHSKVENEYKVTAEDLRSKITDKTKLLMYSSPCNPSGSVLSEQELDAWVEVLKEYPDIMIISDEIYEKINYGEPTKSIGSYEELKGRVATINGLAKGFAMTGWRIGYMAGPSEWIKACEKFQGLVSSGSNTIAQAAGIEAMEGDQSEIVKMKQIFETRRDLMRQLLMDIEGLKVSNPMGAFYHFPDVSHYLGKKTENGSIINTSSDLCLYLLSDAHVATVAGDAFGNPDCIRLSYATDESIIKKAISQINESLKKLL
ncbi:MAG: pyridoxal phosphate-dependent aminotransferase [Bacteroidia bacterium]